MCVWVKHGEVTATDEARYVSNLVGGTEPDTKPPSFEEIFQLRVVPHTVDHNCVISVLRNAWNAKNAWNVKTHL